MPFIETLNRRLQCWRDDPQFSGKGFPRFHYTVSEGPHSLVLLESPGPGVDRNTGMVSFENNDATAIETKRLIGLAFPGEEASRVLLWNAVPWFHDGPIYCTDIDASKPAHEGLLGDVLPTIRFVVLLGSTARRLLPFISPRVGDAHIYGGHHTGAKAQGRAGLREENEAVFKAIGALFRTTEHGIKVGCNTHVGTR